MNLYFDLIPIEITYNIVSKIPFSSSLYIAIRTFKLDEQTIFRMLCIGIFNLFSKFEVRVEYKGRIISWQSVYEKLLRYKYDYNFYDMNQCQFRFIVDIFDKMNVFDISNDELFILMIYDYLLLSAAHMYDKTYDLTLSRYEYLISYFVRTENGYVSYDIADPIDEAMFNSILPFLSLYYTDIERIYLQLWDVLPVGTIDDSSKHLFDNYFIYQPLSFVYLKEGGTYLVAVRESHTDIKTLESHRGLARIIGMDIANDNQSKAYFSSLEERSKK